METSWSLPAVFDVVAHAAPDRDMLVWKHVRRTYANGERGALPRFCEITASGSAASAVRSNAGSADASRRRTAAEVRRVAVAADGGNGAFVSACSN